MKWYVTYECITNNQKFTDTFLIENDNEPTQIDQLVLNQAMQHSIKFCAEGVGSIRILSISLSQDAPQQY
ncbi:hypothetical protein Tola_1056 [Tolumonas auensis DSM 9187]|uniref:Uncharacterized protein n=1 Tax=Tolumonas auensis (strain DSM 9187 / NBRC 110442 / TA 4) TaxID=595494 RepID=C4LCW9_TOLAT|nr:hypothetical protein [Tolumonas auensis]ACQ92683.1 hypothetical protein Tola_1056 [Tolumonas auensis DSM 9187]